MSTIARYYLFQVPGWIFAAILLGFLQSLFGLPMWACVGLFALLVAKDVALYPLLRSAYEVGESGAARLIGLNGTARDRLDPAGFVSVQGELWNARVADGSGPIRPGASIKVVGAHRMTLTVIGDSESVASG